MRMIFCNIQLFSNDQIIQVIDETSGITHYRKVDIEDLPQAIGALAYEFDCNRVTISGSQVYTMAWAEEIKTAYALNYGKNNLEVEII